VRDLVKDIVLPDSSDEPGESSAEEPPAKRRRADLAGLDFLLGGQCNSSSDCSPSEFDLYLSSADGTRDDADSALAWWSRNAQAFPKCACLAKKYLAIPATSVQSERLFSATGRLISKMRSRLLPERAESMVFMNKNMDLFEV